MKHLNKDSKSHNTLTRNSTGHHIAPSAPKRKTARKGSVWASAPQGTRKVKPGSTARRSLSSKTRRILAIVCWSLVALLMAALVAYLLHLDSKQAAYEQLSRMVHGVSPTYTAPVETTPSVIPATSGNLAAEFETEPEVTPTPGPVEIPIDFDVLYSMNDDIIGWIKVEGTDIDYPILYDSAKSWSYIDHDYWLNYSFSGSIYIKDDNASDFSDFNTVIYGHNMNNGSMFAPLHEFRDQEFFDQHDSIVIYTPDRKLTYQIFAAYRTDNKNLTYEFDYDTAEQREEYLEHIYSHKKIAFFDMDVPVTAEDDIITLSTCINHQSAYRYLVQAVLISDQPGVYSSR